MFAAGILGSIQLKTTFLVFDRVQLPYNLFFSPKNKRHGKFFKNQNKDNEKMSRRGRYNTDSGQEVGGSLSFSSFLSTLKKMPTEGYVLPLPVHLRVFKTVHKVQLQMSSVFHGRERVYSTLPLMSLQAILFHTCNGRNQATKMTLSSHPLIPTTRLPCKRPVQLLAQSLPTVSF